MNSDMRLVPTLNSSVSAFTKKHKLYINCTAQSRRLFCLQCTGCHVQRPYFFNNLDHICPSSPSMFPFWATQFIGKRPLTPDFFFQRNDGKLQKKQIHNTDKSEKCLIVLATRLAGLASTQSACSSGSNKTDLATSWSVPLHSGRMSDMLVVSSSMGMLYRLQRQRHR